MSSSSDFLRTRFVKSRYTSFRNKTNEFFHILFTNNSNFRDLLGLRLQGILWNAISAICEKMSLEWVNPSIDLSIFHVCAIIRAYFVVIILCCVVITSCCIVITLCCVVIILCWVVITSFCVVITLCFAVLKYYHLVIPLLRIIVTLLCGSNIVMW